MFVFFKQKTAYEMRITDWSSDVCSSDLRSFPLKLDAFALRSRGILHRVADQYRIEDRFLQPFIFVVIADETELQPTIEQPELGTDLPALDLFGAEDQRIGVGSRRRLCVDIVSARQIAGLVSPDRKSTRLNHSHYCASRMSSYARKT